MRNGHSSSRSAAEAACFAARSGRGFGGGSGGGGGGGFGGGDKSFSTKQRPTSGNNVKQPQQKSKGKRRGSGLSEINGPAKKDPPSIATTSPSSSGPELDLWGLPKVPTLDDIFPPLPEGTEIIPVDSLQEPHTTLQDIEECLGDHMDLQLSRFFDIDCLEKERDTSKPKDEENNSRPRMKLRLLHKSPPVLAIDDFFTAEECREIQEVAEHNSHSQKVTSATFQGALSTRTSTSWFCRFQDVSVLLAKTHHALNVPLSQMEEPQIVRYETGQEFSWHYDEVPPPQLFNGGQRLATLLVYLNTVPREAGGGTTFRDLMTMEKKDGDNENDQTPLVMQPRQGSALLFFPAFRDGRPDDRTLHKSQVMREWLGGSDDDNDGDSGTDLSSTKWIVQMWVHERPYEAVLPPNNSNEGARSAMDDASRRLGYKQ